MALLTWDQLIKAARCGDYEYLCDVLDDLPDGNLKQAHSRDLADLLRELFQNRIDRPRGRPKLSRETLAHKRSRDNSADKFVVDQLREQERREGKQLRGTQRTDAIREAIARLKPRYRNKTSEDRVRAYLKRPKSRRL